MKNTKRSVLVSGLCLLLTAVMLMGSTFAWFTDSVTNEGNKIQSGTLDINLTIDGSDKLFSSDNDFLWEPGRSQKAVATVSNEGSLWLKYTMSFANVKTTGNGDITEVLDVYTVAADAKDLTGAAYLGTMKSLMTAGSFAAKDNVLAPKGYTGNDGVSSETFTLVIKMQESAGNQYQGCGVTFDVIVNATQYTYEEDGFDSNQYDASASYSVVSSEGFKDAIAEGGSIVLDSDVSVVPTGTPDNGLYPQTVVTKDTTLNLNGKTLGVSVAENESLSYCPLIISVSSGTLTIEGNGTLTAEVGENECYGINVFGGSVVINDGNYFGALTAIQVQKGSLIINGGFFDLAPTCKAQVPGYANYVVNCIDSAYKNGTATIEITGGTFVNFDPSNNPEGTGTSYVADGYKVVAEKQSNGETWYTVVPE